MNTFQPTVTHLLDPDWYIEIQAVINAMPETLADVLEPALLGQFHAEHGEPCEPTRYYAKLHDIEAYLIGYKDTAALWAGMVQAVNDGQLALALADEFMGGNQHD
jgi:hypothetical protein